MKFDIELHKRFKDNIIIDYGIIRGNNNILFIKTGQNGSKRGYKDKYLKIAKAINKKYGSTVICSSNPFDGDNSLDDALEVIEKYVKDNSFNDYEIYYMGVSNGGFIGACFGDKYLKIKKMLLVNTPLMYNFYKIKQGLNNFKGQVVLIYGSLDQSTSYVKLLDQIENKNFKYVIIENQDHYFSKDTYDFQNLPFEYLYNDDRESSDIR